MVMGKSDLGGRNRKDIGLGEESKKKSKLDPLTGGGQAKDLLNSGKNGRGATET